jgi:hypothetical protein
MIEADCDRLLAPPVADAEASRLWVRFREHRDALFDFHFDPRVPTNQQRVRAGAPALGGPSEGDRRVPLRLEDRRACHHDHRAGQRAQTRREPARFPASRAWFAHHSSLWVPYPLTGQVSRYRSLNSSECNTSFFSNLLARSFCFEEW